MTTFWEIAILPPLAQFFIALFVILVITSSSTFLIHWLGKGEEEKE